MLFPFVRLEFSSTLGPPPGRYPVSRLLGERGGEGRDGADALLIAVVGAPVAQRFLRRARRAPASEPAREVSILRVTWVQTSQPLEDAMAGRRLLTEVRGEARREALVEHALATLNRAIRAYAAAALDPFAQEVSAHDPREVRLGFGSGEQLDAGEWTEALMVPGPAGRPVSLTTRVRPQMAVAGALLDRFRSLDGELHVLRALLDLDRGRPESALREMAIGLELLAAHVPELEEGEAVEALDRHLTRGEELVRGTPSADELREAARGVLAGLTHLRETAWEQEQAPDPLASPLAAEPDAADR